MKQFKENLGEDLNKTLLGYYIDSLSRAEMIHLNARFEKIGITFSQFRVLNWIWRFEELTQKELHEFARIKPSSLTTILDVLIDKGLVERKQDDHDARIRKIVATESSRALESQAWEIIHHFDQKLRSILTREEYEVTQRSLKKLLEHLALKE
ncbi:MAG: hypothetical protein AVO33_00200 [delta proteobacterium ML8_F1]|nr:MAG: hypothetical protein AVO33_00200 [delta proteobacterium ML8_F1]